MNTAGVEDSHLDPAFRRYTSTLIIIVMLAVVYLTATRNFNIDEFESIHSGWKIANGETIYEDFIQQKNPLLYYFLSLAVKVFGNSINTILVSSYLVLFFTTGILIYTYKLAALAFDRKTAILSLIILPVLPWFALSGYEIRPDVPMIFLSLASLYYLWLYFVKKKSWMLFASALLLVVAYFFLQKTVFWLIIFALVFFREYAVGNLSLRDILYYILTLAVTSALILLVISSDVALEEYFFFTYEFVKTRQSELGGPYNFEKIFFEVTRPESLSWLVYLLFILSLYGKKTSPQKILVFAALWLAFTVFLVSDPGARYFLAAMPFFAIIIGSGMAQLHLWKRKIFYLGSALVITLLVLNIGNLVNANNLPGKFDDRNRQFSRIQFVLDHTGEDDPVYDGIVRFNLFRKDLDFVWLGGHRYVHQSTILAMIRPYNYDIYKQIYEYEPKIISYYFLDMTRYDWILKRYRKSVEFDDVYVRYRNNTGFSFWYPYADKIGSSVYPDTNIINENGDVEVKMSKAAPPVDKHGNITFYPYAGIHVVFNQKISHGIATKIPVDFTDVDMIRLNYRLSGPVSMLLVQDGIQPGNEHRVLLDQQSEFTEVILKWKDFQQKDFVTDRTEPSLDRLTGIKFQIESVGASDSRLGIRNLEFAKMDGR